MRNTKWTQQIMYICAYAYINIFIYLMVIILKEEIIHLRSKEHKKNCRGEKKGLDCCKFITHV